MRPNFSKSRVTGLGVAAAVLLTAGPAMAHETPQEQTNKQVVLDFYAALNDADATHTTKDRIAGIADKYLSPAYEQHAEMFRNLPGSGTDRDKLVRMFQSMPAMKQAPVMPKTVAVMAEDDLVMLLTSREGPDPATGKPKIAFIFNMFRVKDGKLVEHWDVSPAPSGPPPGAPMMPGGIPGQGAGPPAGGPPAGSPPPNFPN